MMTVFISPTAIDHRHDRSRYNWYITASQYHAHEKGFKLHAQPQTGHVYYDLMFWKRYQQHAKVPIELFKRFLIYDLIVITQNCYSNSDQLSLSHARP